MTIAISVENLSKNYRLGQIGTGTVAHDLNVWWAKVRGKPSPLLKIGETNHGNRDGEEIWALKDVSFAVEQGEVLGIIGRNGAGKSTILKILSRVTAPTSGKIKVQGRVASLLEVGTGFHPELTGRENVYLNGAILGMSVTEIGRKFDEIVEFSGVEQFIDTPVKRYSSGMYVRLAFAVAAHLDPEILVVDEVLAVGDVAFQDKCLGKMGNVAKEGKTVLFVSHNMDAIQRLCEKGLLIDKGKITYLGEVKAAVGVYLEQIRGVGITTPVIKAHSPYKRISLLVNDVSPGRVFSWRLGETIKLSLILESDSPEESPRVDLAFYRSDTMKLFAIRSDTLIPGIYDIQKKIWRLDFQISDLRLSAQRLYLDIGVRKYQKGEYLILWQHACELDIDPGGIGDSVTSDSLLLPNICAMINK